jgi:hypothetical protein
MTHTDYCFLMMAVFISPILSAQWRVIMASLWLVAAICNILWKGHA